MDWLALALIAAAFTAPIYALIFAGEDIADAAASARRAIAGAALLAIGWAEAQREAAVDALPSEPPR